MNVDQCYQRKEIYANFVIKSIKPDLGPQPPYSRSIFKVLELIYCVGVVCTFNMNDRGCAEKMLGENSMISDEDIRSAKDKGSIMVWSPGVSKVLLEFGSFSCSFVVEPCGPHVWLD